MSETRSPDSGLPPLPTQPVANVDATPEWMRGRATLDLDDSTRTSGGRPPLEELTSRTIGEFRILRRLGQGGMAEVYLAEQISLHRQVALKVLRREVLEHSDDVLLKRFEQEAKAAAVLNHPNIVQVYGVGEDDGVHFIAQEYVRGVNLREYLAREGPPDATRAVHIGKQIAKALEAAAEAGIVHRDIKPENVMISRKEDVKVADFGLAQLANRGERTQQLTQIGVTMGTPLYMSPEQVSGKPVDARSDVYSFGVTLYHLLAGEPPFRGETALAIALQHVNESPPPLRTLRRDLPQSLCSLVHRMLAKRPGDRPENAAAVLAELKRLGKALADAENGVPLPVGDRPSLGEAGGNGRTGWRGGLKRAVPYLTTAVAVAAVAAAVGWGLREPNPLNAPPAPPAIPKRDNVDEQMWDAFDLGTEEGWQAVVDYFGDDPTARNEVAWAKLRLAVMHVADRRFDEARRLFHAVHVEHGDEPELNANAVAGLALLESLAGRHRESQTRIVTELKPVREEVGPELRPLVREAIRQNRQALGGEVEANLEELFRREDELEPL